MNRKFSQSVLLLLLVLSSLAGTFPANAQWEMGVRGGLSIPNLSSSGSSNNPLNTGYSSRLGPDLGLFGEYHFPASGLFSVEAGLEYSSQGGKKDGYQALPTPEAVANTLIGYGVQIPPYLYANFKSVARLNYLLIPVLAKFRWRLGSTSPWRFYVKAGPYVGFLLSAKQVTSGNSQLYFPNETTPISGGPQDFDQTTDIKNQLHTTNFGVDGSVGLSYALGKKKKDHLFIEAGGNYGFLNIQKGTANGKNNTGAAVATLGYSYRIN